MTPRVSQTIQNLIEFKNGIQDDIMKTRLICLLSIFCMAAGCTQFTPPEGYVQDTGNKAYDYKAVSARGHALGVKRRANVDKSATLQYWTDAIEHQKCDIDGFKLAAKDDIQSGDGRKGVLFNFESGEGQAKLTYLVALFVTPADITTVEAAGPTADFTADIPAIRKSIEGMQTR